MVLAALLALPALLALLALPALHPGSGFGIRVPGQPLTAPESAKELPAPLATMT
ncbi:hypothetical protein ABIA70_000129 [Arthrobacter sp. 754]